MLTAESHRAKRGRRSGKRDTEGVRRMAVGGLIEGVGERENWLLALQLIHISPDQNPLRPHFCFLFKVK